MFKNSYPNDKDRIKMGISKTQIVVAFAIIVFGIQVPGICLANGKISFIAGKYYFEFLLKGWQEKGQFEFSYYTAERLPSSSVFKVHFKHILRIELGVAGNIEDDTDLADEAWNPSKQLILVTCMERAFIMTPEHWILKCYGNVESVKWISDSEIFASVETGAKGPNYREDFIININTDVVRSATKEDVSNSIK